MLRQARHVSGRPASTELQQDILNGGDMRVEGESILYPICTHHL